MCVVLVSMPEGNPGQITTWGHENFCVAVFCSCGLFYLTHPIWRLLCLLITWTLTDVATAFASVVPSFRTFNSAIDAWACTLHDSIPIELGSQLILSRSYAPSMGIFFIVTLHYFQPYRTNTSEKCLNNLKHWTTLESFSPLLLKAHYVVCIIHCSLTIKSNGSHPLHIPGWGC